MRTYGFEYHGTAETVVFLEFWKLHSTFFVETAVLHMNGFKTIISWYYGFYFN